MPVSPMAMASSLATLSDDELRSRLLAFSDDIPPIVDATRSLLIGKLTKLEYAGGSELSTLEKSNSILHQDSKVSQVFFKTLVFVDVEATGLPR